MTLIACDTHQTTETKASPSEMTNVVREVIEVEGVPVTSLAPASQCEDSQGDHELFNCVEDQFWRVLQRDFEQRRQVIEWMYEVETRLVDTYKLWSPEEIAALNGEEPTLTSLQEKYARMVFQRAQLILAYTLEQGDVSMIGQLQSDLEKSLTLHPKQPFYQIWLDTVTIALADILNRRDILTEALTQAWVNVEAYTEDTTRSTLIASLTGTTSGLSIDSQSPEITADLIRTWACHPDELEANPDRICGAHEFKKPCLEWCTTNSEIAPFKAPSLAYHTGEVLARVGDTEGARRIYEFAKTLPGFEGWPYRDQIDDALADMDAHVNQFTKIENSESAAELVYANSATGCVFCHTVPTKVIPQ